MTMTGTAAGANGASGRRGVFDVDEDRVLDALRLSWGDAYDIGRERDRWTAESRDAEKRALDGDTPTR